MGKKARKQAKKKKREKRVQKRKRTQRGTAADEAPTQESDWGSLSPPYAGPNFDSERIHLAAHRLMAEREFGSIEETNAYLQERIVGKRPEDLFPENPTPEEEACELAFQAMEAESTWDQVLLAADALDLDPANLDAERIRIEHSAEDAFEHAEQLASALEEYRLRVSDDDAVAEEFGSDVLSRPYLRTLAALGRTQRDAGDLEGAIQTFAEVLELNPRDPNAVAEGLLACHLEAGDHSAAREILDRDGSPISPVLIGWARVLERYVADDLSGARIALAEARLRGRVVGSLLTGTRDVETEPPTSIAEVEAFLCYASLLAAWDAHPDAVGWLIDQMA